MTKKLLIVSGSYPNLSCGVSGHVKLIAALTAARGKYDVEVLTGNEPQIDRELPEGYVLHAEITDWRLRKYRRLCDQILAHQPDIVHVQNPTIRYYGAHAVLMSLVAPRLKKLSPQMRLVVMQHDIAVGRPLMRWRYYPLFRACDAIFVSNSRDEQAVRRQGIPPEKIYRTPVSSHFPVWPRTTETRAQGRAMYDIAEGVPCVAYFGFVHPGRNVEVLLQALARLREQRRDLRALIIGGPFAGMEDYYQRCRHLAGELGLDDCVIWTGYATEEQVAAGLAAADVFVSLLQRGADLRNTSIITAMLADLPVVTTGNERYYVDEELRELGCACVKPDDTAGVATALEQQLQSDMDPAFLEKRRAFLDPDTIWSRHIDVHERAYEGEKPPEPARFGS